MNVVGIVTTSLATVAAFLALTYQRRDEKRRWNVGHCPDCGGQWRRFDTDSQGGRGYRCDGGHHCWISYSVDR